MTDDPCFTRFHEDISFAELPVRFTYPFFYTPHPLCVLASGQLQDYLQSQSEWQHDFGIDYHVDGVNIGKMFGVLLVRNSANEVGFLSAFSGKLAGSHSWSGFVPPIADYLLEDGYFRKEEKKIAALTDQIKLLSESSSYQALVKAFDETMADAASAIASQKKLSKTAKQARKTARENAEITQNKADLEAYLIKLSDESKADHFKAKDLNKYWKNEVQIQESELSAYQQKIELLKSQRREKSAEVQEGIFSQYQFLNQVGQTKGVKEIFVDSPTGLPPSGAGDCAAPKLLQYAFENEMKPLALAEFWWGQSPKSEIRTHGQYYPSCKGKCYPILGHMLSGFEMDESPLQSVNTDQVKIEIVYEDDALLVINKPAGLLSVPGKNNQDSVQAQMEGIYPQAKGTMMVHRLDRATSGLMVIAKSKSVHKILQAQFLDHSIRKRYVALLAGILKAEKGTIELPLRPDLDDRPRQLVDFEHGKKATTHWKKVCIENGRTRIHFFPMTGRTHQLRMHAAHLEGLGLPIVGDDLYGISDQRMCLHAQQLTFIHPQTEVKVSFFREAEF